MCLQHGEVLHIRRVKNFHPTSGLLSLKRSLPRVSYPGGWVRLQAQAGYFKPSKHGMNYIPCENQVNHGTFACLLVELTSDE